MDLERFCATSRVVIVAGKGGVGKTTVTAALGAAAARQGMSVLVVEVEGKSGLAASFGCPPLAYHESELRPGLRARTLTPDAALVEYLEDHGLRRISRRLASSGALDVVATAVPGMKDILVLGKVKQLELAQAADLIVIDAPAAGHAITFLTAARTLVDMMRVGPVRKQAADVAEMLTDPTRCHVVLVTIPEETPVNELVTTAYALEDRAGLHLGPVVVNALVPAVDGLAEAGDTTGAAPDDDAAALEAARRFRLGQVHRQTEQVTRLGRLLPLPQVRLPFMFTADIGPAEVDQLADAFTDGIESLATPAGARDVPRGAARRAPCDHLLRNRRRREDDDGGRARRRSSAPGPPDGRRHDRSREASRRHTRRRGARRRRPRGTA